MTILWQQCKLQYVYRQTPNLNGQYISHRLIAFWKYCHLRGSSLQLVLCMDVDFDANPRLLLLVVPMCTKETH